MPLFRPPKKRGCILTERLSASKAPLFRPSLEWHDKTIQAHLATQLVTQAIRLGSIPFMRGPRAGSKPSVFIPESFLPVWAERGHSPKRDPALTAELEACYDTARALNRVGI